MANDGMKSTELDAAERVDAGRDVPGMQRFLSVQEFCELTGLSHATVRRRICDGSLPVWQPGGRRTRVLILADDPATRSSNLDATKEQPVPALIAPRIPGPRPRWQQNQEPNLHTQPEDYDAPEIKK